LTHIGHPLFFKSVQKQVQGLTWSRHPGAGSAIIGVLDTLDTGNVDKWLDRRS
jgi:hypothetical protein